jgi:hypothetical protein
MSEPEARGPEEHDSLALARDDRPSAVESRERDRVVGGRLHALQQEIGEAGEDAAGFGAADVAATASAATFSSALPARSRHSSGRSATASVIACMARCRSASRSRSMCLPLN